MAKPLYTHTESPSELPPDQFCLYEAARWTNQASNFSSSAPTFLMADFDQRGKMEDYSNWPFKVALIPREFDFPEDTYDVPYEDYLTTIEEGTVLYDLYAMDKYKKDDPDLNFEPIGHIELKTRFTRSKWADEKLYFRHTRYEEELARRPEWADMTPYTPVFELPDMVKTVIAMDDPIKCPFAVLYEAFLP